MTSLLSIFDPSSKVILSNWWILIIFLLFPMKVFFWKNFSLIQVIYVYLMKSLLNMFKPNEILVFVTLFIFLLTSNLMGLVPYSFSLSSHFTFNFFMAFTFWFSSMMWGMLNKPHSNIAHLTPMGCPLILVPFMVLVETISMFIRPITLSLRLMSNMMAGHMIITLISGAVFNMFNLIKPLFLFLDIFFFTFELGVAVIQAYVFTMLMSLYWEENE